MTGEAYIHFGEENDSITVEQLSSWKRKMIRKRMVQAVKILADHEPNAPQGNPSDSEYPYSEFWEDGAEWSGEL